MEDIWRHSTSRHDYRLSLQKENDIQNPVLNILISCHRLPHSPLTWIFLMTLGILAAILGALLDASATFVLQLRQNLLTYLPSLLIGFLIWCIWCISLSLSSSFVSHALSKVANGSGIPQMKVLLSGHGTTSISSDVLSYKTLVAKAVGTVLAIGSGLSVGKEGPFVHIMSIVAHKLGQIECFKQRENTVVFIRAGVAAGVTAVFGTPLGGVLFSIEVTSNFYQVDNLWQGVICSSLCVLTFQVLRLINDDVLFENTTFNGFDLNVELVAFLTLGMLCGLLSALIIDCIQRMHRVSTRLFTNNVASSRYTKVLIVALITASFSFPFSMLSVSDRQVINELFSNTPLSGKGWHAFSTVSPLFSLFIYTVIKGILTILPCGLPIPSGIFTPLFVLGAAFGRLYGEILYAIIGSSQINSAAYAVVGAASLTAATTHTVSTAVIVFELTGQLSHMLPVMLSVLMAYSVGGSFKESVYDVLGQLSGLPHQGRVSERELQGKVAHDASKGLPPCLALDSTIADARNIIVEKAVSQLETIAIVNNFTDFALVGAVKRSDLVTALARMSEEEKPEEAHSQDVLLSPRVNTALPVEPFLDTEAAQYTNIEMVSVLHHSDSLTCSDASQIPFGLPYGPLTYTAVPIDTYPPQVGYLTPLSKVYSLSCLCFWTTVYVTKDGQLVGLVTISEMTSCSE